MLEYVKYTNRHALVQEFVPTADEQHLYDLCLGLPPAADALRAAGQPASADDAYPAEAAGLLDLRDLWHAGRHGQRLEAAATATRQLVDTPPEDLPDDWEELDELADEWDEDETNGESPRRARLTPEQLSRTTSTKWPSCANSSTLAKSIVKNSKGEVLLTALRRGFAAAAEAQRAQGAAPAAEGAHLHRVAPDAGIPLPAA